MKIVILRELHPGETRVAGVPETVSRYVRAGNQVAVESQAGEGSFIPDSAYSAAGASIVSDVAPDLAQADLVLKVMPPLGQGPRDEVAMLKSGCVLVAMLGPQDNAPLVEQLARKNITSFSLDQMPRITRAQSMDVLSSMSTLTGYKAMLMAMDNLPRISPMMMTAAGTIAPAKVLVIGAGVAGLQAVGTARRLGAIVTVVDARPAVRQEAESLGAKFVGLEVEHAQAQGAGGYAADLGEEFYQQEQKVLSPHVLAADVVITSALVPGRRAPILITEAMVSQMKSGSVIVDLAGSAGGNCTLSKPDQRVVHAGVTILAPLNLPVLLSVNASQMYSRNVSAFLGELIQEGQIKLDMSNEILRATLVTHEGQVVSAAGPAAKGGPQ